MVVFERSSAAVRIGVVADGWRSRLFAAVLDDRSFHFAVAAYACAGAAFAAASGHALQLDGAYLTVWTQLIVLALGLTLVARAAAGAVAAGPGARLEGAVTGLRLGVAPEQAAGLLLFASLGLFTATFTAVKCILPHATPFWADGLLADFDRALFFGRDPWRWLQPLLGSHAVTAFVEFVYGPVWISMMLLAPLLASAFVRRGPLRSQFLTAYLLAWSVNGTLVAGLMMSAGPAFFAKVTGDATRFGELVQYLQFSSHSPLSASAGQHMLWLLYMSGGTSLGAGISAFPSMHMSMTTLCVLAAWRINRRLGWAISAFAVIITAGSIHLGWHYAADGLFAVASSIGFWFAAGWAGRRASATADPVPA